jgi:ubiquitin-like protein Pup
MARQEHVTKSKSRARAETKVAEPEKTVSTEALRAEMDSVLGDIDAVLVENAEEFVKRYVQKGGQ